MATPKKKPVAKKQATEQSADLTPLEVHSIQLHEYYKALRKAGFDVATCITLICDKDSHPSWFKLVPDLEAVEDEEDED